MRVIPDLGLAWFEVSAQRSPVRRRVAAVACGGADLPSGAEIGSGM